MSQLVELNVEECLALLRSRTTGRIAVTTPAGPKIFPVNYALHDDTIVFRTVPYGEIANNAQDAEVAFEVDRTDEEQKAGWSVMAVGTCRRVADPDEVRMIKLDWDPAPWADGQRILYLQIQWKDLTGRQVGLSERPQLS